VIAFLLTLLGRVGTLLTRLTATRASNLDFLTADVSTLSPIKSIQYGTLNIAGSNTTDTNTVSAVNVAKSVLIPLGQRTSSGTINTSTCTIELTNPTTITATRWGVDASSIWANFCLVEFN
jgi:hypothetical protein